MGCCCAARVKHEQIQAVLHLNDSMIYCQDSYVLESKYGCVFNKFMLLFFWSICVIDKINAMIILLITKATCETAQISTLYSSYFKLNRSTNLGRNYTFGLLIVYCSQLRFLPPVMYFAHLFFGVLLLQNTSGPMVQFFSSMFFLN